MIRTILFFVSFGIVMILSLFFGLIYLILGLFRLKKPQKRFVRTVTRTWGKIVLFLSGNKLKTIGSELVPAAPVLFVGNHQSYGDIPICLAGTPHFAAFIAKVELKKAPILSWWMEKMGCLFIDRQNMRQSLQVILDGIEMLKAGDSLIVFPEGTRMKDGEMGEFKLGSLKIAAKAKVPIVPVTIRNSYKLYEEKGRVQTCDLSIQFHQPIDVSQLSPAEVNKLHETVRDIIKSGL